jgi:hypothetical protein
MNDGLVLETDGVYPRIRRGFHSNRSVILRDRDPSPTQMHNSRGDASETTHSHSRSNDASHLDDPRRAARQPRSGNVSPVPPGEAHDHSTRGHGDRKPVWRTPIAKKCWVCNNIVCSCEHKAASPPPDLSRTSSRHQPSDVNASVMSARGRANEPTIAPKQAVATSFQRTHTHQPSVHERLFLGRSARPKEQFSDASSVAAPLYAPRPAPKPPPKNPQQQQQQPQPQPPPTPRAASRMGRMR